MPCRLPRVYELLRRDIRLWLKTPVAIRHNQNARSEDARDESLR